MKAPVTLLTIGGGIIVVILILIVVLLQNRPPEPQTAESPKTIVENVVERANDIVAPREQPSAIPTQVAGNWYEHRGLMFRIPKDWEISTSATNTNILTAYPKSSEITSVPRLQIMIDKATDRDYVSPAQRYTNYTANREIIQLNSLVISGYKSEHPEDIGDPDSPLIQGRVAVLEKDAVEFTLLFQYKANADESVYTSIIESLRYR